MQLTAEEKFNQAVAWVTQEIKKQSLVDPEEFVRFEFKSYSDGTIPSIDDQKLAIKALINAVALEITENIYPYSPFIRSAVASIGSLEPHGYALKILLPNFEIIRGQPYRIHEFIKEKNKVNDKEFENTSSSSLKPTAQKINSIEWVDNFRWQGDTFVFGDYGKVNFSSDARKALFRTLTDAKGDWVSVGKLKGHKDTNYTRATIKQIEDRLEPKLKKHISIPSTQDDDAGKKPLQGAYRIKFDPNPK